MKNFLILLIWLAGSQAFSQTLPDFESIRLQDKADYKPAEPAVLQACGYILGTPHSDNDIARLRSLQFLIRWMSGTPDYTFTLGEKITSIAKGNNDLLGLYMACLTDYCLREKKNGDHPDVEGASLDKLIAYCMNPENKCKPTKALKKLAEERKRNE